MGGMLVDVGICTEEVMRYVVERYVQIYGVYGGE